MTRAPRGRSLATWIVCVALLLQAAVPAAGASALPTGGHIPAGYGSGSINSDGTQLTVKQQSDRLVIHWDTFSIGSGNRVVFEQTPTQIALNRVTGTEASEIYGKLDAGGQIFLINPRGIVIGNGAVIDVGGLVATTLGLSDDEFMNNTTGSYGLAGDDGGKVAVEEGAQLTAEPGGYLVLLAPEVENAGTLDAPEGRVGLGAGVKATLVLGGTGFDVTIDEAAAQALIDHSGAITADGGAIVVAARASDAVPFVVNHEGVLQASAVSDQGGRIVLKATSGDATTIEASGGRTEAHEFELAAGGWEQVSGELPLFKADDFRIGSGARFVRAAGGEGTLSAPYKIVDVYGLQGIGSAGMESKHYELAADIDASVTEGWHGGQGFSPIGEFEGVLDGQGHVIEGLYIDRPGSDDVGLFGVIGAGGQVRNLSLLNVDITGRGEVGALAGEAKGAIEEVHVSGLVTSSEHARGATVKGMIGGLAGKVTSSGSIVRSSSAATVPTSTRMVGGLVGFAEQATIEDASATGQVGGYAAVGGLVGEAILTNILDSYATGEVTGDGGSVGGLAGYAESTRIEGSYATGNVSGRGAVGGLVGGIDAKDDSVIIRDAYATGDVTAFHSVGGLVGSAVIWYPDVEAVIERSFATGGVEGINEVGGLIGELGVASVSGAASVRNVYATGDVDGEDFVGGLVGIVIDSRPTIEYAYATGSVSSASDNNGSGGLVGSAHGDATIRASFYATTRESGEAINNNHSNSLGVGRTWEELTERSTFEGWSIDDEGGTDTAWRIYEGHTTPLLRTFLRPLDVTVEGGSVTYDGNEHGGSYEIAGPYDAADVSGVGRVVGGGRNAGTYTLTVTGLYSHQFG